ncbi:MAG: HTTM domain-containing protein [Myxococcales bacterium]|nr:HTTM domain-containing protein [Myxococcales bacterium]
MILELLDSALTALHAWLATPQPTLGLALSRIALGTVLAVDGWLLLRRYDAWYGPRALSLSALDAPAPRGSSRLWLRLTVACGLMLAAGLATRPAGAVLLLARIVMPLRNRAIAYGGDGFARTVLLLLLASPCDASLAVDRWLADGSLGLDAQASPWGGRLLQLEVAALYLISFVVKLPSAAWRQGTVMIDLLRNPNFACRPRPELLTRPLVGRLMTWGALAIELGLGPVLLVPSTAAVAVPLAIAFHLSIALLIDVHLFSAVMAAALLACLPAGFLRELSGAGPAPALPPLDALAILGVLLALGYVVNALLGELCAGSQPEPGSLRARLRRLGWIRGWRLFTTSAPTNIEVELTVVDEHGQTTRWAWLDPDDLLPRGPRPRPLRPDHRFQRFKFSLLHIPAARRRLVQRFRAALREAGITARAWSIDLLYLDIHSDHLHGGTNLGAQVAAASTGRSLDLEAAERLAATVRCPATRTKLLALPRLAAASSSSSEAS